MSTKKWLLWLGFLLATLGEAKAQEFRFPEVLVLKGRLIKKPWTKSTQSYCAQGSEYYVLQMADGQEHILEITPLGLDLSPWEGRRIKIEAMIVNNIIHYDRNETGPALEQRPNLPPGQTEFVCEVLRVMSILSKQP
ncbi:MAG: hypothetical protein HC913_14900 [Microscillaceae bacterium]|nr:hypothetical protein [Microscillaceae bacterium]